MKFLSVVFALSLVFFAFAAPSPATTDVEVSKRQLGGLQDILGLLTNAQNALGPILSTLTGLASSGGSPIAGIGQVTGIVSSLTSTLAGLAPVLLDDTTGEVENAIAGVVGDIVVQLGTVVNLFPSNLLTLLAVLNLDLVLQLLLIQLSGLISGILLLITPIVAVLTTLTGGLGLTSVLGLLGLL